MSEPRRWILTGHSRWLGVVKLGPIITIYEAIEVMPVSEHEELREAARSVVDQDRSTTAGEAAFEDAVHRLWLLLSPAQPR